MSYMGLFLNVCSSMVIVLLLLLVVNQEISSLNLLTAIYTIFCTGTVLFFHYLSNKK